MRWQVDPTSRERLQDQIARCVRRGIAAGDLTVGDPLPPAAELGAALSVDRNTVLAGYRQLRDEGLLEFRRGRGVRVAATSARTALAPIADAVRALVDDARHHGLTPTDLIRMIEEIA